MIAVNSGVVEFIIAASDDWMYSSPVVMKIKGSALAKRPIRKKSFQAERWSFKQFPFRKLSPIKMSPPIKRRKKTKLNGVKDSRPYLINKNDGPQQQDKLIKRRKFLKPILKA